MDISFYSTLLMFLVVFVSSPKLLLNIFVFVHFFDVDNKMARSLSMICFESVF